MNCHSICWSSESTHSTVCLSSKLSSSGRKTVGCWLVCQSSYVCRCMHVLASVCVCLCINACIHFISAGCPVHSPQSDAANDGCAAVICFICLGVSLASLTTEQPSMLLSDERGITHQCSCVTSSRYRWKKGICLASCRKIGQQEEREEDV